MREGTTSRVMAADKPYGEFYDFGYEYIYPESSQHSVRFPYKFSVLMSEKIYQGEYLDLTHETEENRVTRSFTKLILTNTVRSESRCALRLQYVDLVVNIEVAVAVC
jgi:hypothetical protein